MSVSDAVRTANESLEFLRQIDAVILESDRNRMAPVFERVLTNNQPTFGFIEIDRENRDSVPTRFENRVLPILVDNVQRPGVDNRQCGCSEYPDCREGTPRELIGLVSFSNYAFPWQTELITNTKTQVQVVEVAALVSKLRRTCAHLINETFDIPDTPEAAEGAPWNTLFKTNFMRPDLRDLYADAGLI